MKLKRKKFQKKQKPRKFKNLKLFHFNTQKGLTLTLNPFLFAINNSKSSTVLHLKTGNRAELKNLM